MKKEIQILVNGESRQFSPQLTLETLLKQLQVDSLRVAVALNEEVLPRSQIVNQVLQNGDRIEIIHAVAGG